MRRELERIERLVLSAAVACDKNIEIQSEWARYICVLSAGFVESSCREFYKSFCKPQCSPAVYRYIARDLDAIQNPKSSRLVEVARVFDETWGAKLEAFLQAEGRADAIDSIMSNRHLIAHGRSSGISLARIAGYFELVVEVMEFMEDNLAPPPT